MGPSTKTDESITFSGASAEDCEIFLATVHQQALTLQRWDNEKWIIFYAESLLRGDALIFYESLETKTRSSWAALRTAFVDRYVRSTNVQSIASLPNTAPTPAAAAAPPAPVRSNFRQGRIAVIRQGQTKCWLSTTLNADGYGLTLCNSVSQAQVVSFTLSGSELFEMQATGDPIVVLWPNLRGDEWADTNDYFSCIAFTKGKKKGEAQSKVWAMTDDCNLQVRFKHSTGMMDLSPIDNGTLLHLVRNAGSHCGVSQGSGYSPARLVFEAA